MGILEALVPVNKTLELLTGLVRGGGSRKALQAPKVAPGSFSSLLEQRIMAARAAQTQARQFIALNDSNADQTLSISEAGMSLRAFARLDLDSDLQLSLQELTQAYSQPSI